MMSDEYLSDEIEVILRHFFEQNYETLRLDGGRALAPDVREAAWQQVRLYWIKLRNLATKMTDTEVKLHLPGQTTPKGRPFGIEGVVDIVREEGHTTMYDIKTHDRETICGNLDLYEQQLNVYAYIWLHLRGQGLDEAAIISTSFPDEVKTALYQNDPDRLTVALARWEPIVRIPFNTDRVEATIRHFGQIVDAIEDSEFAPAPIAKLQSRLPGMKANFASQVCINCDARYSCDSFRAYVAQTQPNRRVAELLTPYIAEPTSETELTERLLASLDATPAPAMAE